MHILLGKTLEDDSFGDDNLNLLCLIFKAHVLWRSAEKTITNGKAVFITSFILSDYVRHSGDKAFEYEENSSNFRNPTHESKVK